MPLKPAWQQQTKTLNVKTKVTELKMNCLNLSQRKHWDSLQNVEWKAITVHSVFSFKEPTRPKETKKTAAGAAGETFIKVGCILFAFAFCREWLRFLTPPRGWNLFLFSDRTELMAKKTQIQSQHFRSPPKATCTGGHVTTAVTRATVWLIKTNVKEGKKPQRGCSSGLASTLRGKCLNLKMSVSCRIVNNKCGFKMLN